MKHLHAIFSLFLTATSFADSSSCPTTDTSTSLVEVHGSTSWGFGRVWYGTEKLAVLITVDGHWPVQSAERDYSDKLWWWREGYIAADEPYPELVVTARRLDSDAPQVKIDWTTNALFDKGDLMLNGPGFPTSGCWEVTGTYRDESLTFVTRVGERSSND